MNTSKVFSRMFVPVLILLIPVVAYAQGRLEDYERADRLRSQISGLVYNGEVRANWINESSRFWYRNTIRGGSEFVLIDAERNRRGPAFDHRRLAQSLSAASDTTYTPDNLPFDSITFVDDENTIEFIEETTSIRWSCDLETYVCTNLGRAERPQRRPRQGGAPSQTENEPVVSPDGEWEAYIYNFNVYIRSTETREEFQLSWNGSEGRYFSDSFIWSPDSKKLVTNRVKPGYERLVHYVESSPEDQLQPKHSTRVYTKPGDELTIRKPHLFLIESKKHLELDETLFQNPYRIRDVEWRQDSRAFTFEYNQRGHQAYRVIEVDANTGSIRALIDEVSSTFVDYNHKLFRYDIDDGKEIVWASERDGWNHLYLYDGMSGMVKNQITKGEWVMRGVEYVDEELRQIWFRGSGHEQGQDPYFIHYYRINFDGSGLIKLTEGNGNHSAQFSPDSSYFVDNYSRVDAPPVSVLRRAADGRIVMELEKADIRDLLDTGWRMPEPFVAQGRDGTTDIWGIICRPMNFDESKKYPVIEYIYAGPHSSHVPKTFRAYRSMQALAELGFIVVQIDGMGTSNRSKAFHDVCWKNLGDAGFPDRILWHKAAAAEYPSMDISRVGIYGTSAGGQNSMGGVLFHPDFYKVAVSSCGCHDNRMDKIWWNELWMGYPIGPHYSESSNRDNAYRLQGKLLLILGEMDTNVDPSSTLQVVDALIKADKDFDFLFVPGMGHSGGGEYGERKRRDFFVRHLLGIEPPGWNQIGMDR
ncbi:DPP IV N-terminal domain-containing protein [candidate division KSB1 bacterium]